MLAFAAAGLLSAQSNNVADRFLRKAEQMISERKYADAISQCNQLIKWKADIAEAYELRGMAYAYSANRNKALEDYTQAIKLNPRLITAYEKRARLYQAAGDNTKAIADYSALIQLAPGDAANYRRRSYLYLSSNQPQQALKDLDEALNLDPNCTQCYKERALLSGNGVSFAMSAPTVAPAPSAKLVRESKTPASATAESQTKPEKPAGSAKPTAPEPAKAVIATQNPPKPEPAAESVKPAASDSAKAAITAQAESKAEPSVWKPEAPPPSTLPAPQAHAVPQASMKELAAQLAEPTRMDTDERFDPQGHFKKGEALFAEGKLIFALHEYTKAIQQQKIYPAAYQRRAEIKAFLGDKLGADEDMALSQAATLAEKSARR